MRHLNLDPEVAHLFQRLAARILFSDPSLRPRPHVLAMNTKAQTNLWAYGISGDFPIVLVRINNIDDLPSVRQLLQAHEYLRLKNLKFDLVILNDHPPSYIQSLQDETRQISADEQRIASAGQKTAAFFCAAPTRCRKPI